MLGLKGAHRGLNFFRAKMSPQSAQRGSPKIVWGSNFSEPNGLNESGKTVGAQRAHDTNMNRQKYMGSQDFFRNSEARKKNRIAHLPRDLL